MSSFEGGKEGFLDELPPFVDEDAAENIKELTSSLATKACLLETYSFLLQQMLVYQFAAEV